MNVLSPRIQSFQPLTLASGAGVSPKAVLHAPAAGLKNGSSGPAVGRLQDALVLLGHVKRNAIGNGAGNFGNITEGALKSFQRAHHLTPDGVYGPKTRAALSAAIEKLNVAPPKSPAVPAPHVNTSHRAADFGDRGGAKIDSIVYHHTASNNTAADLRELTSAGGREVSANYLIGRDGTIYQLVPEGKAAWHAGTASLYGTAGSVNARSIGIEITNAGDGTPFTEAQYKALEKLTAHLTQKYQIPPANLVGHADVALPPGRKSDPADNFDFKRIRRATQNIGQ